MNIHTSYFGNLQKIPGSILPVSIARFPPKWFKGSVLKSLAPPEKLLWKAKQGKISEGEYTRAYIHEIEKIFSPESLYKELLTTFTWENIALLCFEKKGEFCHRRVLAEWLSAGLKTQIMEL